MKCHYIYDPSAGKVLVPYCWAVVNSGDMTDCQCRVNSSFASFEKQEYNDILKEKNDMIKALEIENASLNRIIKKLIKAKCNG